MDFPKSVPGVGLVDGKFVDENQSTGQVGSLIPSAWGNAVTEELLNVIQAAGLEPDEEQKDQLLKAVRKLRGGAVNFGLWQFSAAGGNPGAGRVTLNNGDPALASALLIAESSAESLDYSPSLGMLRAGDTLSLQERDALDVAHRFRVTGPAVDHGTYREIPVSYVSGSGGVPAVDTLLSVLLTQAGASDAAVPLFAVQWWPSRASIPAGYAPADGQALPRATFPDAWAGILAGNVPTVAEATWQSTAAERGKYTAGDGASTFRLPDYNGKAAGSLGAVFLRGDGALSAAVSGAIQRDALQDFTGTVSNIGAAYATGPSGGGIAEIKNYSTGGFSGSGGSGGKFDVDLKASNVARTASETRPLNVTGCWVVKLFGAVTNPGSADAAQLATDYAALVARVAALESPRPMLHVRDEKPSGTAGGTFTSGAWRTRDLNTVVVNTIPGAILNANQITLPAGVYEAVGYAPHHQNASSNSNVARAQLYNVTAAAVLLKGTQTKINGTAAAAVPLSPVEGRFTLAVQSVIELQHRATATNSTEGFGVAAGFGDNEIYSNLIIKKVG